MANTYKVEFRSIDELAAVRDLVRRERDRQVEVFAAIARSASSASSDGVSLDEIRAGISTLSDALLRF